MLTLAAQRRYSRYREIVIICTTLFILVLPRPIIGPYWMATMDPQRLRSPANLLRLSGAQGSSIVQTAFR